MDEPLSLPNAYKLMCFDRNVNGNREMNKNHKKSISLLKVFKVITSNVMLNENIERVRNSLKLHYNFMCFHLSLSFHTTFATPITSELIIRNLRQNGQ